MWGVMQVASRVSVEIDQILWEEYSRPYVNLRIYCTCTCMCVVYDYNFMYNVHVNVHICWLLPSNQRF